MIQLHSTVTVTRVTALSALQNLKLMTECWGVFSDVAAHCLHQMSVARVSDTGESPLNTTDITTRTPRMSRVGAGQGQLSSHRGYELTRDKGTFS